MVVDYVTAMKTICWFYVQRTVSVNNTSHADT